MAKCLFGEEGCTDATHAELRRIHDRDAACGLDVCPFCAGKLAGAGTEIYCRQCGARPDPGPLKTMGVYRCTCSPNGGGWDPTDCLYHNP